MTAELALALPAVVLVVAALLVTGSATVAQLRAVDAARTAARMASLGHTEQEVGDAAARLAGARVVVEVSHDGGWVDVTVRRDGPGSWFTGGPLAITARASVPDEP